MRSEIMCLVINRLLHLFDVWLFIVKYLDCHARRIKHKMQHSWVLEYSTSGLLSDSESTHLSSTANVLMQNCIIVRGSYMSSRLIHAAAHDSRYSMLCFKLLQNITNVSNWIVEFQNFQGQLWQKTISHWIWNFHVKIWRISRWMFCI